MRGLCEDRPHQEGTVKIKITAIEIAPPTVYDAMAVKTLRLALGLSQTVFAQVLGVAKKTVEACEAGRNVPNGAACRFLEVLRKDPGFIQRERIMTYVTQPSSARTVSKSRGSTSQIAAKTTGKVKDRKTPIVQ